MKPRHPLAPALFLTVTSLCGAAPEAAAPQLGPTPPRRTEITGTTEVPMMEGFHWAVVEVRINDRGPFVKDRIIDLSYGAADELGMIEKGTTQVEVRCTYSEETLREKLGYWVRSAAS